ncbi:unnamed protein product, partial [Larinioides sclopetarius]
MSCQFCHTFISLDFAKDCRLGVEILVNTNGIILFYNAEDILPCSSHSVVPGLSDLMVSIASSPARGEKS